MDTILSNLAAVRARTAAMFAFGQWFAGLSSELKAKWPGFEETSEALQNKGARLALPALDFQERAAQIEADSDLSETGKELRIRELRRQARAQVEEIAAQFNEQAQAELGRLRAGLALPRPADPVEILRVELRQAEIRAGVRDMAPEDRRAWLESVLESHNVEAWQAIVEAPLPYAGIEAHILNEARRVWNEKHHGPLVVALGAAELVSAELGRIAERALAEDLAGPVQGPESNPGRLTYGA